MPMRREDVAAALKYLGEKADLRGRVERAISLDPQEQDLADLAVETGASFIPGVGPALAARDVERARRANDPAGMAMAAASAIPGERLAKLLKGFDPTRLELDVYHGTPHRFPATETVDVYRGENASNIGGNYWSTDPEFAQQFTQRGLPEEVKRSTLSMSDVYSPPSPVFAGDAKAVNAAIAEARKLGKSAVRFSEGKGQPDSFFVIEKTVLGRKGNPLGEFDASKIGTGEGAQAYGHGTYYAESPDVAKTYRSSNDPIARKAEMLLQSSDGDVSRAMRYAQKKVEDLEKNRDVKGFFSPVALEQNKGALEYLKQIKSGKTPNVGSLYKADLPDEMIDRMLDWDKPLSQQPAAIQEIARKIGMGKAAGRTKAKLQAFIEGTETPETARVAKGGDLYLALSDYGNESVAGTRALQEAGIPGIKYRDAGSRGQGGSGTRNFVVFPGEEKKVKILERK